MLPMDKVELTAFRFLGGIGSCFTLFQSIIWLGLSLTGAACKYLECGATNNKSTFAHCFYLMYVYSESDDTRTTARLNYIKPYYFHILMWINVALCLINFLISAIMLNAFLKWVNAVLVKRIANIWTICIILFSIIEFFICLIFIYDICVIAGNDDSKCFKKFDITIFRSNYEPKPAPYLRDLKHNLNKLKRKIRKLRKDLMYLHIVVDENNNSTKYENPFISKTLLNNHVKEIWHDMFKNNITDKIQQNIDFHPHDEVMKIFLATKQFDLDEVDTSLLESFDNLTNIKWVKPVESSNVVIGRKYDLDPKISSENQSNINNMAFLLHEYLNNINKSPEVLIKADKLLDNVTRRYLGKLSEEMHGLYNEDMKNKFKNITKEIVQNSSNILSNNYEEKEVLYYLQEFFNGLMSLEQVDDNMNENAFQSILDKIKELFRKSEHLEIDDDQKVKNIKEYLRRQYGDFDDKSKTAEMSFRRVNSKEEKKEKLSSPSSSKKLVNELCEHCVFFVLWPSIVCMLLSLKTGLVWFMNIIVVSLVLYYGDKIEVQRKCRLPSIIKCE